MNPQKSFWEDTYQRNIKKMIGICFRYVSDRQIAENLAHDAFIKAMYKSDTFKGKGNFEAWLRKITVNTVLQHLRDEKAKTEKHQRFYNQDLINNDEEMDMWQNFTIQELLETVNKLPEHHKLVFNLYVIDKFSHKQIAERLNISEGTSKSHLARARKKLQQLLNDKLREKEKKSGFILMLLPLGCGKIDKLYSNRFSNYNIEPQNTLSFDNFDWNNIKQPTFTLINSLTIRLFSVVGLIAILASIALFNYQAESNITKEKNTIIQIDTILRTLNTDTTAKPLNKDTILKNTNLILDTQTPSTQPPVVIKKKRLVHKKLVVRDTLKITDTTNVG